MKSATFLPAFLYKQKIIILLTTVVSLVLSNPVLSSIGGQIADEALVVALTPKHLGMIVGTRPDSYSLAAVQQGRLRPIPYQFDEITKSGFVYMEGNSDKAKKENPIEGKVGLFDGNDELLFMLKDAGSRKPNMMNTDGEVIAEIAVDTYDGKKKYVYLMKGSRLESDIYYVRFSAELGRVETDYYALKVNPDNAFMWEEFYYDSFDGVKPGRPLDTITLRMYSRALAFIPLNLNNKHMVAEVVAEKSGPIRSTTQYKVSVNLLKAPIMKFDLQIVHHEQAISYNSRVEIPPIRRRMVSKAAMNASVDGLNLYGAEVYASTGPKKPAIVDGKISDVEKEMLNVEFQTNEPSWVFLDSKYKFSYLNHFIVETDEEIPMGVVYEENKDKELPPEYYKGQMPMLGFMMHRNPMKGFMQITNATHMFNKSVDIDVTEFADLVVRKPKVSVKGL